MLNKIKRELFYTLFIGLLVHYLTTKYKANIPEMPIAIPAFIGTAISVILSFKLNQSYDRWWEARKVWGSIVNESRSFVLQLQSFISNDSKEEIKEIAYRQIAWCFALSRSLRNQNPLENLDEFLSKQDLEAIEHHKNKPLAILQLNSQQIASLKMKNKLDLFGQVQINTTLVNFSTTMGMAERIKTTVFPVTYRLFLHFLIYIFVVVLSISLRDIDSIFEMPLLITISSAFFLLEKSATQLQDPFMNQPTDTAMTTISRTIEINIKQLLGEKEIPEPIKPEKFYAL